MNVRKFEWCKCVEERRFEGFVCGVVMLDEMMDVVMMMGEVMVGEVVVVEVMMGEVMMG